MVAISKTVGHIRLRGMSVGIGQHRNSLGYSGLK
jgi:hypothetical protein